VDGKFCLLTAVEFHWMNLTPLPNYQRKPDKLQILCAELREKNDIIKQLQNELKLVKQALLESSLRSSQLASDLEKLQDRLATAEADCENWKKEAFSNVSGLVQTAVLDVKASPEYKQLKKSIKSQSILHAREIEALKQQHSVELARKQTAISQPDSQFSQTPTPTALVDLSAKDSEIETLREQLRLAQEQVESLHTDNDNLKLQLNSWSILHEEDVNNINMLVSQLRAADEHVLEQADLYQDTFLKLQAELQRRDNCRNCRKLLAKK
jgi:hypothetical protein